MLITGIVVLITPMPAIRELFLQKNVLGKKTNFALLSVNLLFHASVHSVLAGMLAILAGLFLCSMQLPDLVHKHFRLIAYLLVFCLQNMLEVLTLINFWNQDYTYPFFANYWGGANGWYRVAYKPVNGSCRIGNPPFGLSSAFPQGGFVAWAAYKPLLGELGVSLFRLSSSTCPADQEFIRRYYLQLAVSDDSRGAK